QFSFIYKEMRVFLESVTGNVEITKLLFSLPENRVAAGRSILDIKYRIIFRLLGDFLEIEVQRGVALTVKHHETDRITTDFIAHVAPRDALAGALRHAYGLA